LLSISIWDVKTSWDSRGTGGGGRRVKTVSMLIRREDYWLVQVKRGGGGEGLQYQNSTQENKGNENHGRSS